LSESSEGRNQSFSQNNRYAVGDLNLGLPTYKEKIKHCNILELKYEGWNFISGNYLFSTDTK